MLSDPHDPKLRAEFHAFVDERIAPFADAWDAAENSPRSIIAELAAKNYLAPTIAPEHGGAGMSMATFGDLAEEIGRGSASLLSLLTVHGMAHTAIGKWGQDAQKQRWLPKLAKGEAVGAFALTEPDTGSDARSVSCAMVEDGDHYVITGVKKWISFAQAADVFIIVGSCGGKGAAFIVERNTPGLTVSPIKGMLGFRSAMIGEVKLDGCRVPKDCLLGGVGFGFTHVVSHALDFGRFCIACAGVGVIQGALDACLKYASERKQFDDFLRGHQLIQRMVANMATDVRAARLLVRDAAALKDAGDPDSILTTTMAKYFASRAAVRAAVDAVQIHGGNGCHDAYPVARYYRDAKVLEIIEGSSEMQQIILAKSAFMQVRTARRKG